MVSCDGISPSTISTQSNTSSSETSFKSPVEKTSKYFIYSDTSSLTEDSDFKNLANIQQTDKHMVPSTFQTSEQDNMNNNQHDIRSYMSALSLLEVCKDITSVIKNTDHETPSSLEKTINNIDVDSEDEYVDVTDDANTNPLLLLESLKNNSVAEPGQSERDDSSNNLQVKVAEQHNENGNNNFQSDDSNNTLNQLHSTSYTFLSPPVDTHQSYATVNTEQQQQMASLTVISNMQQADLFGIELKENPPNVFVVERIAMDLTIGRKVIVHTTDDEQEQTCVGHDHSVSEQEETTASGRHRRRCRKQAIRVSQEYTIMTRSKRRAQIEKEGGKSVETEITSSEILSKEIKIKASKPKQSPQSLERDAKKDGKGKRQPKKIPGCVLENNPAMEGNQRLNPFCLVEDIRKPRKPSPISSEEDNVSVETQYGRSRRITRSRNVWAGRTRSQNTPRLDTKQPEVMPVTRSRTKLCYETQPEERKERAKMQNTCKGHGRSTRSSRSISKFEQTQVQNLKQAYEDEIMKIDVVSGIEKHVTPENKRRGRPPGRTSQSKYPCEVKQLAELGTCTESPAYMDKIKQNKTRIPRKGKAVVSLKVASYTKGEECEDAEERVRKSPGRLKLRGTGRTKPEKPFLCTLCGDRYQYKAILVDHYEAHHHVPYPGN